MEMNVVRDIASYLQSTYTK